MRSLMIVVPDEFLHRSAARRKRKERPDVEAFVIDGAKKAFDLAIRLGRVRPQEVMANVVGGAHLLKARQPRRVPGVAHREGEGVIREDRLDPIRQGVQDVLEKAGGGDTGLVGVNSDHRFTTEVIDGGKFEIIPGISQGWQVFQVEVQELTGSMLVRSAEG